MGTIRRYDSRKLYDPEASRYVSLEEIADRIRDGEEIEVVESATGEDVTGQTLAQVLLEEGRSGRGRLPAEVLHDLVRVSGRRLSSGLGQVQTTMNRLMRASLERLAQVRETRRHVVRMEERMRELEQTLHALEKRPAAGKRPASGRARGRVKARSGRRPSAARKGS
jgi:polyhydroxyalkanoate synthesis repressor PhaR